MKIYCQLNHSFEKLKTLLERYNESLKANFLCQILCLVLYFRPVKSMKDKVDVYRSINGIDKTSYHYLKSHNTTHNEAKILLKKLIQGSDYIKNNIN
jgi:hypothetical protein